MMPQAAQIAPVTIRIVTSRSRSCLLSGQRQATKAMVTAWKVTFMPTATWKASTMRREATPRRASPIRPGTHPGHARPVSGRARPGRATSAATSVRHDHPLDPVRGPVGQADRDAQAVEGKADRQEQQAPLGALEDDDRDEDREHRHQGVEHQSESDDHGDRGVDGDHGRRDPQPVHAGGQ